MIIGYDQQNVHDTLETRKDPIDPKASQAKLTYLGWIGFLVTTSTQRTFYIKQSRIFFFRIR